MADRTIETPYTSAVKPSDTAEAVKSKRFAPKENLKTLTANFHCTCQLIASYIYFTAWGDIASIAVFIEEVSQIKGQSSIGYIKFLILIVVGNIIYIGFPHSRNTVGPSRPIGHDPKAYFDNSAAGFRCIVSFTSPSFQSSLK